MSVQGLQAAEARPGLDIEESHGGVYAKGRAQRKEELGRASGHGTGVTPGKGSRKEDDWMREPQTAVCSPEKVLAKSVGSTEQTSRSLGRRRPVLRRNGQLSHPRVLSYPLETV